MPKRQIWSHIFDHRLTRSALHHILLMNNFIVGKHVSSYSKRFSFINKTDTGSQVCGNYILIFRDWYW